MNSQELELLVKLVILLCFWANLMILNRFFGNTYKETPSFPMENKKR